MSYNDDNENSSYGQSGNTGSSGRRGDDDTFGSSGRQGGDDSYGSSGTKTSGYGSNERDTEDSYGSGNKSSGFGSSGGNDDTYSSGTKTSGFGGSSGRDEDESYGSGTKSSSRGDEYGSGNKSTGGYGSNERDTEDSFGSGTKTSGYGKSGGDDDAYGSGNKSSGLGSSGRDTEESYGSGNKTSGYGSNERDTDETYGSTKKSSGYGSTEQDTSDTYGSGNKSSGFGSNERDTDDTYGSGNKTSSYGRTGGDNEESSYGSKQGSSGTGNYGDDNTSSGKKNDSTFGKILEKAGNALRLWDARSGKCSQLAELSGENINITYKPDGTHVAVGNRDDELTILDVRKFKPIHKRKFNYEVNEISWDTTGEMFFLTTGNGTVEVLTYPALRPLETLMAHTAGCYCIAIDPLGRYFAVGSADSLVSLWDISDMLCVRTFTKLEWPVRTIGFNHTGEYIASASEDLFIDIASVQTGRTVHQIPCRAAMNSVEWNPKYNLLAYAGDDKNKYQVDEGVFRIFGFEGA